ncbi:MAG TPA: autotransporter-associated beta strand repeat-containing protein [Candidatus Methylacidiphilales bacterium]
MALATAGSVTGAGFLNTATVVTLGGGTFAISGAQSTALTQTLSQIALQTGSHSTFSVAQGSATSLGVTLSNATAINRGAGATVDFEISGGATLAATTAPTTSNGILSTANTTAGIAYATYGGTTWATVSGSNVTGYTGWVASNYATSANNVDVGVGDSLSGSTAVNTLRFNSSNSSLAIGSGNTLSLTDSAILVTSAATSASISGGTLSASGGSELVVVNNGSLNISSTIANNAAAGVTALTLSGNGTTVLSNTANTYTGATYINGGTVSIAAAGSLSSGVLNLNGGTLLLASGYADTSLKPTSITLGNDGGTINTNGANITYSGVLSGGTATGGSGDNGAASYFLVKSGSGTLTLGGSNTYAGATKILGGTLSVSSLATETTSGGVVSSLGKSPNLAYYLVIDNGATLQYTGAAGTTDRLFTIGQTGDTGAQSGNIDASGTGAIVFSNTGSIAFAGTGNRTLGLTGTNTGNNTLAASVGDASGGTTSLTKSGAGTWLLTGANTYTGATTVNAGTLLVNGSLSASSPVSVASAGSVNAVFGGTGTVGAVTAGGGAGTGLAIIAAGGQGAIGTFSMASLTMSTKSEIAFDINSTTLTSDRLNITGALALGNGVSIWALNDLGSSVLTTGTTFVLANAGSGITGFFQGYADGSTISIGGNTYQINYGTLSGYANDLTLEVVAAAVPEPSTWLLLAAGCAGVALVGRRRGARAVA